MFKVEKMMVNPCQECTHVISDETGQAVIIDCGVFYDSERRRLLKYLDAEGLAPVRLLVTHAHHDHVYGNDLVFREFGLLPEVHEGDKSLVCDYLPKRIQEVYGDKYPHELVTTYNYLHDDEQILFGNHVLDVIHVPGHTPGSVVFYCREENTAFTGDTIFAMSIGRTDLVGGDDALMTNSLAHLLKVLPDNTIIYPGHGRKTTIGSERVCNPYLVSLITS